MDKVLYFSFVPGNRVKYIVTAETKYGTYNIVPSDSMEDVARTIEALRKRYRTSPLRTLCGTFYKKDKDGNFKLFRSRYSKIDRTWEYLVLPYSDEQEMIIAENENGDEICGTAVCRNLDEAMYMRQILRAQTDTDLHEFSAGEIIGKENNRINAGIN